MFKMDLAKPSRKDLMVSAACLAAGIALMGGAVWYKSTTSAVGGAIAGLTEKKVASAVPTQTPPKATPYSLKKQESPFASLTPQKISAPPALPPMPSVPVNLAAPQQSQSETANGRKGLHVTSVFVGKGGRNIAVLSDGKIQVTAREGKDCKFGYVDEITKEGVSVGGRWLEISKNALEPDSSAPAASTIQSNSIPVPAPQPNSNPPAQNLTGNVPPPTTQSPAPNTKK